MSDTTSEDSPGAEETADLPATLPAGVVLAGGQARRMGGLDKPMLEIAGKTMLERVIDCLRPQVDGLVINANGDPGRFAAYALPVVADTIEDHPGPLAGLLAGMRWAALEAPEARFLVSVAADTPFIPDNLVARLSEGCGRDEETIALAASPAGTHPVCGLWPIALADDLEKFLEEAESGKILTFADRHLRINVPFEDFTMPDGSEVDPFFNVNTPEDAERAAEIAAVLDGSDD